jgi:hypothetical protein
MPLFGSTYLEGNTTSTLLPGNSYFKITFKNGGVDTFIKILSYLIKGTRKAQSQ